MGLVPWTLFFVKRVIFCWDLGTYVNAPNPFAKLREGENPSMAKLF